MASVLRLLQAHGGDRMLQFDNLCAMVACFAAHGSLSGGPARQRTEQSLDSCFAASKLLVDAYFRAYASRLTVHSIQCGGPYCLLIWPHEVDEYVRPDRFAVSIQSGVVLEKLLGSPH